LINLAYYMHLVGIKRRNCLFSVKEEYKLKVFEDKVPKKIYRLNGN